MLKCSRSRIYTSGLNVLQIDKLEELRLSLVGIYLLSAGVKMLRLHIQPLFRPTLLISDVDAIFSTLSTAMKLMKILKLLFSKKTLSIVLDIKRQ